MSAPTQPETSKRTRKNPQRRLTERLPRLWLSTVQFVVETTQVPAFTMTVAFYLFEEGCQMDKPIKHIVSLSGGKDSTAMLLRMLDEGMPVDEILFCDTGLEFEGLYRHIDKLEKYIGRPITRLKSDYSFEYLFFDHMPKRRNPELVGRKGFSWAGPHNRWCTAMLKTRIINRYLREQAKTYTIKQYIGIAADEPQRIHDYHYPLVDWGMTEADCLAYCRE